MGFHSQAAVMRAWLRRVEADSATYWLLALRTERTLPGPRCPSVLDGGDGRTPPVALLEESRVETCRGVPGSRHWVPLSVEGPTPQACPALHSVSSAGLRRSRP